MKNKKQDKNKPVSRVLFPAMPESYHLSGPNVTIGIYRPTRCTSIEQREQRCIHPEANSTTYLVFQPVRFALPGLLPKRR